MHGVCSLHVIIKKRKDLYNLTSKLHSVKRGVAVKSILRTGYNSTDSLSQEHREFRRWQRLFFVAPIILFF